MPKKVKKMPKILIERLLNTRFRGKIGAIKIKENPNVWSNQKMYSEQEIPGPADPNKKQGTHVTLDIPSPALDSHCYSITYRGITSYPATGISMLYTRPFSPSLMVT